MVSLGVRRVTKLVLFPVRFLLAPRRQGESASTMRRLPLVADYDAPGSGLAAAALRWRTDLYDDDQRAVKLLRSELTPLYVHYIEDQITRLTALNQSDLAAGFERWRERLLV